MCVDFPPSSEYYSSATINILILDFELVQTLKLVFRSRKIINIHNTVPLLVFTSHLHYHDKCRKALDFQEGGHVFLRVTPVTGVGREFKSQKLTPHFIGPYKTLKRVGEVAYQVTLPLSLLNLHNVFHVSQLCKYVPYPSHVIQSHDMQIRDNLTYETFPLGIED